MEKARIPLMRVIRSRSWLLIEMISFVWKRKLQIRLINFLLIIIEVSLKRSLSNRKWSTSYHFLIMKTVFNFLKLLNRLSFALFFFCSHFVVCWIFCLIQPSWLNCLLLPFAKVYHAGSNNQRPVAFYLIFWFTSFVKYNYVCDFLIWRVIPKTDAQDNKKIKEICQASV